MSDVLKRYSILIGADTKDLMDELNNVEKELKKKLNNVDLGAGIREDITELTKQISVLKSEVREAKRDLMTSISDIGIDNVKQEFQILSANVASNVDKMEKNIKSLQTSFEILNGTDLGSLGNNIGRDFANISTKIDDLLTKFGTFHTFMTTLKSAGHIYIDTSAIQEAVKNAASTIDEQKKIIEEKYKALGSVEEAVDSSLTNASFQELSKWRSEYKEFVKLLKSSPKELRVIDGKNLDYFETQIEILNEEIDNLLDKTGQKAQIYLRWKTELDDSDLDEKIDKYISLISDKFDKKKKDLLVGLDLDTKGFSKKINDEIKAQNALLKEPTAPKIKVDIELDDVDKKQLEEVSKNINANITGGSISGEVKVASGTLNIDSADKLAQQSTLSEIKDILSSWNGSGFPGAQTKAEIHQENKIKSELQSANSLVRGFKFYGAGTQQVEAAELRQSLLNRREYDYARRLALKQVTRKGKKLDENSIKGTRLWDDTVEVEGVQYAKWDTQNRTIEDFRKYLIDTVNKMKAALESDDYKKLSSDKAALSKQLKKETNENSRKFLQEQIRDINTELETLYSNVFKQEIKNIDKRLKVSTENLGSLGVEFDKEGKILQRSSTAIGKNEIYGATYSKVDSARQRILNGYTDESGNYQEGLEVEFKELQILKQRRQLMQEIVQLDNKNSKKPLDENEQQLLEQKKEQLRLLTQEVTDQKLYNQLLEEGQLISEKMEKGDATFKDLSRLEEISTQMEGMFKDVSDDMVKYSHDNVEIIDAAIDEQSKKVNKLSNQFRKIVRDIYNSERAYRKDKGTDFNGDAIIDESILNIDSSESYERAIKELASYRKEMSVLEESIVTDKNGSKDYSSLTKSEQERYATLQRSSYELSHQIELYAKINKLTPDIRTQVKPQSDVQKVIANAQKDYLYDKDGQLRNSNEILGIMSTEELQQYSSALEKAMQDASDKVEVSRQDIVRDFVDERIKYLQNNLTSVNDEIAKKKEIGVSSDYLESKAKQIQSDIDTLETSKKQIDIQDEIISSIQKENNLDDETIAKLKEILDLSVQIEESRKRLNEIGSKASIKIGKRDQAKYDEITNALNNDKEYDSLSYKINNSIAKINSGRNNVHNLQSQINSLSKSSKPEDKNKVKELESQLEQAQIDLNDEIKNQINLRKSIQPLIEKRNELETKLSSIIKKHATSTRTSSGKNATNFVNENQKMLDLIQERQRTFSSLPYAEETEHIGSMFNILKGLSNSTVLPKYMEYYVDGGTIRNFISDYIQSRLSSSEFEKTVEQIFSARQSMSSEKELASSVKSRIDAELEKREQLQASAISADQVSKQKTITELEKEEADVKAKIVNYDKEISILQGLKGKESKEYLKLVEYEKEARKVETESQEELIKSKEKIDTLQQEILDSQKFISKLNEERYGNDTSVQLKNRNIIDYSNEEEKRKGVQSLIESEIKTIENNQEQLNKEQQKYNKLLEETNNKLSVIRNNEEKLYTGKKGRRNTTKKNVTGLSSATEDIRGKISEFLDKQSVEGTTEKTISLLNDVLSQNDEYVNLVLKYIAEGGNPKNVPSYFYDIEETIGRIIAEQRESLRQLNELKSGYSEVNKDNTRTINEIKYLDLLKEEYELSKKTKKQRKEENIDSDLFSYTSKNSVTKGMSSDQRFASFKVDYQLNEITKLLSEQEKLKTSVGETSVEYQENATKIQQAKQYLMEFRNEAVELGLTISQSTGRAILDLSKDSVTLGKDMFTGITERYARTKEQLKEVRDENASIAKENKITATKEKELQDKITAAKLGTAKAEGTAVSAKKEISKSEKYTVNMTKEELELRQRLSDEQTKYFKLRNSKASKEELETQRGIVEEVKKQVEEADRLVLVKKKGRFHANLKAEYLPEELQKSASSNKTETNYSSTAPATEGTLSQIRDILVDKLDSKKSDNKTYNKDNKSNSKTYKSDKQNKGKYNQEEAIKIAKELGLKIGVSKNGNEFLYKKDWEKVNAEMDKRGISRYIDEETKSLKKNTEETAKNTKEKKKNKEQSKESKQNKQPKEQNNQSKEQEIKEVKNQLDVLEKEREKLQQLIVEEQKNNAKIDASNSTIDSLGLDKLLWNENGNDLPVKEVIKNLDEIIVKYQEYSSIMKSKGFEPESFDELTGSRKTLTKAFEEAINAQKELNKEQTKDTSKETKKATQAKKEEKKVIESTTKAIKESNNEKQKDFKSKNTKSKNKQKTKKEQVKSNIDNNLFGIQEKVSEVNKISLDDLRKELKKTGTDIEDLDEFIDELIYDFKSFEEGTSDELGKFDLDAFSDKELNYMNSRLRLEGLGIQYLGKTIGDIDDFGNIERLESSAKIVSLYDNVKSFISDLIDENDKLKDEETKVSGKLKEFEDNKKNIIKTLSGLLHFTDSDFTKFDSKLFGTASDEYMKNALGQAAYFTNNGSDFDVEYRKLSKYVTEWSAENVKIWDKSLGFSEEEVKKIINNFYNDVSEEYKIKIQEVLNNISSKPLYEIIADELINFKSLYRSNYGIDDLVKYLGYDGIYNGDEQEYAIYNLDKLKRTSIKPIQNNDGVTASSIEKMAKYPNELLKAYLDGVEASTQEMIEAWKVLAQIPEEIIRQILDINSPSKVMEKLGFWTVEGFTEGIRKDSNSIKQAIQDALSKGQVTEDEVKSLIGWNGFDLDKDFGKRLQFNKKSNTWKNFQSAINSNDLFNYKKDKILSLTDARKLVPKGLKIEDDELRSLGEKVKGQWRIAQSAVEDYITKKKEAIVENPNEDEIDVDKLFTQYKKALITENNKRLAIENGNSTNKAYNERTNAERNVLEIEKQINEAKEKGVEFTEKQVKELEILKGQLVENLKTTKISGYEVGLNNLINSGNTTPEFIDQINILSSKIKDLKGITNKSILTPEEVDRAKTLNAEISSTIKRLNEINNNPDLIITNFDSLSNSGDIVNYLHNMQGVEKESVKTLDAGTRIVATIKESNGATKSLEYTWDNVLGKFVQSTKVLSSQLSLWDRFKNTLSKSIGYFKSYFTGYMVAQRIVSTIRTGVSYIKELDSALTEMKKVSDESVNSLKNFQKESFDVAKSIGSTATEIQNSAADFMRLGYSLKESTQLAKDANIYANVGDMEISEATEHMISSIKAWESEFRNSTEASTALIDKYNEIGNNYAITSADIGSAMERSAAALKVAGNTLDESIGLITAGNLIQQDADTTANALKVMSLRIRGSKSDLEEMGEETETVATSTSKLRKEIQALTGVDIMENDSTYKSTARIIQEIGEKWENLDDVTKAATLEKLAGKTRASTVAGLLENYKVIADVAEDAANAEGSAMRENLEYMDSIEGRLAQLTTEIQRFWSELISSDAIKTGISLLTDVMSLLNGIVDKAGVLGTLAIGGSIFAGIKDFGRGLNAPSFCVV